MKKLILSGLLVLTGATSWWLLSRSARFSINQWDSKFENVLRMSLDDFGLTTGDIQSSVHEVQKDQGGDWIFHKSVVNLPNASDQEKLKKNFAAAGGDVVLDPAPEPVLYVRRAGRLYQEIHFTKNQTQ